VPSGRIDRSLDEAASINYDDLLRRIQKETRDANSERIKQGYEPIQTSVGLLRLIIIIEIVNYIGPKNCNWRIAHPHFELYYSRPWQIGSSDPECCGHLAIWNVVPKLVLVQLRSTQAELTGVPTEEEKVLSRKLEELIQNARRESNLQLPSPTTRQEPNT
jgi:hypothetical protein